MTAILERWQGCGNMKFFPDIKKFAWESTKSVNWNTQVQKSASGRARTLTTQLLPAWTIECSFPGLTDVEARTIFGFVNDIKGSHEPFYWLDPEDNREENILLVKLSDTEYQAVRRYGGYVEPVEYIEDLTIYVNGDVYGSAYTVDGGVITFITAPAGEVTADFTYYWKVRLVNDGFSFNRVYKNINKASLKLEVVR